MGTIFKIALRNLVQHKVRTVIIGVLITLGITLTFVGNSLFDSAARGVKRSYSENFTGDVMVMGKSEQVFSLFGSEDPTTTLGGEPEPVIQHYSDLVELLKTDAKLQGQIRGFTAQVSGFGILDFDARGMGFNLLFGVEPDDYFDTFHSIKIAEGRMLKNGEVGIMMSKKRLEDIKRQNKVELKVGQDITLNGFSKSGIKIRTVPLVGVYEYVVPTQALDVVSFIDVQTLRALNAMTLGTAQETPIDAETKKVLDSADDFFSGDTVVAAPVAKAKVDLNNVLGDKTQRAALATVDSGAWHNLMIRLNDGVAPDQVIADLNQRFQANDWPLKAVDWKKAAGTSASFTDIAQIIFNIVVIILAIVAVIIIINTLVISVMERTSEIGTMRALGAQKPFIRALFVWETMTISIFFGVIGIVIGSLAVLGIAWWSPQIDATFFQAMFGGNHLTPSLNVSQVLQALGYTLFIGVVSWVYPVSIALKVSPLKAISTE